MTLGPPRPPPRVVASDAVLYLDFDGVLHPEDVWQLPGGPPYVRSPPGHDVFENALALERLLEPYPDVRIVLSTTWQRRFGYSGTVEFLRPSLQARCVGGTYHRSMGRHWFDNLARGEQVLDDVSRRRPKNWLAIDDNTDGWGDFAASHLVATDPVRGIANTNVYRRLNEALKRFALG